MLFLKIKNLRSSEIREQLGRRKLNGERCAGPFVGSDGDLTAMGFDDQPRDVEAEPEMGAVTQVLLSDRESLLFVDASQFVGDCVT